MQEPMYRKLRSYMRMHRIHQCDVAQSLGCAPSRISELLSGKRRLTVHDYERICLVLGIEPGVLYQNESD